MPHFSVVIPLFNKAASIEKCMQSVLNQDFDDFELLVINDGSTDESLQKARQFDDARIKIITQENAGVSAARNKGVSLADAQWVAFLDADDYWDPHFLSEIKYLQDNFSEADIFATAYSKVKNGRLTKVQNHETENFKGYFSFIRAYSSHWWMPLTSSSVVVSKEALKRGGGFPENIKMGEDFLLWVKLILQNQLAFSNQALSYYNQDSSLKERASMKKDYSPAEHFIFHLDFLKEKEQADPSLKYLIDGLKVRALHHFYRNRRYRKQAVAMLKDINFSAHPKKYARYYTSPFWMMEMYLKWRNFGVALKRKIKR